MNTLIRYTKNTGTIKSTITSNVDFDISKYIDDNYGAIIVEGGFNESEDYYVKNNTLTPYPEKPEGFYIWNGTDWILDIRKVIATVLNLRQSYLQESDWTDTVSAQTRLGEPLYLSWQIYRQALRDVPSQEGYPLIVTWPIAPE